MKYRILLLIAVLAMTQLACALVSQAVSQAEATLAPVAVAATDTPEPTLAPTASPQATVEPTEAAPTPEATAQEDRPAPTPAPTATLPPAVPGPETLDLSNPDIYRNYLSDYTSSLSDDIQGTGMDGADSTIIMRHAVRVQSQPQAWWYTAITFDESTRVDTISVDGGQYLLTAEDQCSPVDPGSAPEGAVSGLAQVLTGSAKRVATDVEINGLMTDQYAIEAENIKEGGAIKLVDATSDGDSSSTSTLTIKLHGTGSLYLAQQGGFVIRLELNDASTASEEDFFFEPGSEMTSNTVVELLPTQAEDGLIVLPEACGGTGPGPGAEGGSGEPAFDIPRPDDVQILSDDDGSLVYMSSQSADELKAYYLEQMEAEGFSLDSDMSLGPIIQLEFSRDDISVSISIMPTGGNVTVTVLVS